MSGFKEWSEAYDLASCLYQRSILEIIEDAYDAGVLGEYEEVVPTPPKGMLESESSNM